MADYNIERLNFLVVDDNHHMRHLVRMILKSLGVNEIMEAEDGSAALRTMENYEADIVICDWNMQPMDGIAFTKMIRTSEDSPNIYVPIIMLTGHTEISRVKIARDAGVNEFLAKPVSAHKIYQRIKSVLDNPRQYVRTPTYFGPNRRRRDDPSYDGEERRKALHKKPEVEAEEQAGASA